jgi:peroxiredoxin
MNNTYKVFVWAGLIVLAVVVLAVALFNTSKTNEQKQQAVITTNDLIGKSLPEIELRDKEGQVFNPSDLKGKNVVLFFNEGLMCYPACWNQMAAFGTDPRFNSNDVAALSVITDSPQDWQKAIDKMPDLAKAVTLFDKGATSSHHLGILSMGSSMHTGQLPGHTYIMLDKQGIVRDVFDDANMGVNNDAIIQKMEKY